MKRNSEREILRVFSSHLANMESLIEHYGQVLSVVQDLHRAANRSTRLPESLIVQEVADSTKNLRQEVDSLLKTKNSARRARSRN